MWKRSDALLFIDGRLFFHVAEDTLFAQRGKPGVLVRAGGSAPTNSGGPSVLIAYGKNNAEILKKSGIPWAFVDRWEIIRRT